MIVLLAGVTFGIIEGPGRGWGSPLIVGSFAGGRGGAGRAAARRVAARRAPARPALLRERAVLGGDADRGRRVRRVRRVPLPQHALPAGRARLLAAARRAAHPADGRDDGRCCRRSRAGSWPRAAPGCRCWSAGPGSPRAVPAAHAWTPTPRCSWSSRRTWCSASASAWSTRRSRTPRCPACRVAQAGVAAGVASTSRQVGSALGVAVLGSLVTAQLGASMTAGSPTPPAPPGSSSSGAVWRCWSWAWFAGAQGWPFDVPWLIVLQRRPASIALGGEGAHHRVRRPGRLRRRDAVLRLLQGAAGRHEVVSPAAGCAGLRHRHVAVGGGVSGGSRPRARDGGRRCSAIPDRGAVRPSGWIG